jgi:hypothetical protein
MAVFKPSDISVVSNHQGTGDSKGAGHNRKQDGFHYHQNWWVHLYELENDGQHLQQSIRAVKTILALLE